MGGRFFIVPTRRIIQPSTDTIPDAFTFTDQTNVAIGALITSAPVTITGINAPSAGTVSGGAVSINGGAFVTSPFSINNGDSVRAQHTSSGAGSTVVNTLVTIGGVSDTFSSTTVVADGTPDAFSFTDQPGVSTSATITSLSITVTGINLPVAITITGGTYEKNNNGSFTSAAGTVVNGDTIRVRHTSSASNSTAVDTVVTIGGVSDTFTSTTAAGGGGPTGLPLLQASDFSYTGSFGLPNAGGASNATTDYGGRALTFYRTSGGAKTLFACGHDIQAQSKMVQFNIPNTLGAPGGSFGSLPTATVVQSLREAVAGRLEEIQPPNNNTTFIYGAMIHNGRMIFGAANSYSDNQISSIGVNSNPDNLTAGTFQGWYNLTGATAPIRAQGGWMCAIPTEWQSLLGGPAAMGNGCISVIGSTSNGMAFNVFDPATVGPGTINGQTLMYYPTTQQMCSAHLPGVTNYNGCDSATDPGGIFTLTTRVGGMFIVPGTRTLAYIGTTGVGCYWYGTADAPGSCGAADSADPDNKGPHAPPYRAQAWLYDLNDLLAVKNGTKSASKLVPYAIVPMPGMPNSGGNYMHGATYDSVTKRLYITENYGNQPRCEVWSINAP